MSEYLELKEEYNKDGVCIRRTVNGADLPNDKHPSVVFTGEDIRNAKWIEKKSYMTPEEVKHRYGDDTIKTLQDNK